MIVVNSPQEMQSIALKWRSEGQKISFVPTMGALHEGHLSLLREGRRLGDILVLSIYINPTQFAPTEDLSKYPRDTEGDLVNARKCKTDIVFFPSNEEMYPNGYQTYVEVTEVTKGLCGASRPTHFRGVTTIVQKLFNIVQPHVVLLGEKDYQQLVTIKTMVRDLNLPIEVIGMPIVREEGGLAMSSRNVYLSPDERKSALSLSRSSKIAQETVKKGETDAGKIINTVKKIIESEKFTKIDYVKICDSETLGEIDNLQESAKGCHSRESGNLEFGHGIPAFAGMTARLLLAVFVGTTRLIDNCQL